MEVDFFYIKKMSYLLVFLIFDRSSVDAQMLSLLKKRHLNFDYIFCRNVFGKDATTLIDIDAIPLMKCKTAILTQSSFQ